jgi:hypothetical protein
MDRTSYIKMCQAVSLLPSGVLGIKKRMPEDLTVVYGGIKYYPISYELSFKDGTAVHTAILHDINTNSVTKARLDRVEEISND